MLNKIKNMFKSKQNHYKLIYCDPENYLNSTVLFNDHYMMRLGTAEVNKDNHIPVEEWLEEHFYFQDDNGKLYYDESAGLRYSSNFKFKFAPFSVLTKKEQNEQFSQNQNKELTQNELDDIYIKSMNVFPQRDS